MLKKLHALYGLKFHPFGFEVPAEDLWVPPAVDHFCWRLEQQLREGGFAMVSGPSGCGKSAALRVLAGRLARQRDVTVGILSRPQAGLADFYRELGALFGVVLTPHNRWASSKLLREKWCQHLENTRFQPVLLIDEAQEMGSAVLCELRLLSSVALDSRSILTVVLAGDDRLVEKLASPELVPLASRIRVRLRLEALPPQQLLECLQHLLAAAGHPKLMTAGLRQTLCEHAVGNLRLLMNLANDLLTEACRQELSELDEKLYLTVFAPTPKAAGKRPRPAGSL